MLSYSISIKIRKKEKELKDLVGAQDTGIVEQEKIEKSSLPCEIEKATSNAEKLRYHSMELYIYLIFNYSKLQIFIYLCFYEM